MKEQAQMLLELGFPLSFKYKVHSSNGYADNPSDVPEPTKEYLEPTYWEVKQWLWEKHKMVVCCDISRDKDCHCVIRGEDMGIIIPEILEKPDDIPRFNSPITAEIEGIKKAVQYLHSQSLTNK